MHFLLHHSDVENEGDLSNFNCSAIIVLLHWVGGGDFQSLKITHLCISFYSRGPVVSMATHAIILVTQYTEIGERKNKNNSFPAVFVSTSVTVARIIWAKLPPCKVRKTCKF